MTPQEKKEFEARYGNQDNVVRMARYPDPILGIGIEYIVYKNKLIAKYFNGKLVSKIDVAKPAKLVLVKG